MNSVTGYRSPPLNSIVERDALKKEYEAEGFRSFGWSNADRIPERLTEGAEIVYEIDSARKLRAKLVNRSGQVLIGRKGA